MKVTEIVAKLAEPVVKQFGCELWDVEYVREGDQRFLRLYLDKEGGVDITDCENISRAVDPLLDIFHIPQLAAELLDNRLSQLCNDFSYLHLNTSNQQEREASPPLSHFLLSYNGIITPYF